jgi:hypothetical protein
MAERNTISEPAVDTRGMRQLGNVSQPTDTSDTEHYFFSLSSFVFPNFLSHFLFLPRWCVCVCVYIFPFSCLSLCLSYFILSSCLLSFFNSHSADAIGFLPPIPFSSKPVSFTLHLGGSVSIPGRSKCDLWLKRSAWIGLSHSTVVFSCLCR